MEHDNVMAKIITFRNRWEVEGSSQNTEQKGRELENMRKNKGQGEQTQMVQQEIQKDRDGEVREFFRERIQGYS